MRRMTGVGRRSVVGTMTTIGMIFETIAEETMTVRMTEDEMTAITTTDAVTRLISFP